MAIDTKHVKGRRTLRFETLDDVLADAEAVVAAEKRATLKQLGNWTPGRALAHLAAWANYPYDGYPPTLGRPSWFIRWILGLKKHSYIHHGLPAGVRIPKVEGGTVGADEVSGKEGLKRLQTALERMKNAPPTTPNLIFGSLSHREWMALQCRHAELHLSFFDPGGR